MNATKIFIVLFVGTAVGCVVWLSFFRDAHDFHHDLSQQDRAAQAVGATERPTSKMQIEIQRRMCANITDADIDGKDLTVHARNDCHRGFDYLEYHYELLSPDGTAIAGGYHNEANCPIPATVGSKAECKFEIPDDDRAKVVRVWMQGSGL